MGVVYATRESVKSALDSAETARNNRQVDRALESASRTVEGLLKRRFYPWTGTRYKDWPNQQYARAWRLWLDADELVSLATLVAGSVTIPATDYFLEPKNIGPPYSRIEIDLDSASTFSSSGTPQRAIAITGVFGYTAEEESVGTLAATLSSSATGASPTWTADVGVGDIVHVDSERMIVTDRTMVDSTQNLGGSGLAAQANAVTVAVSNGAVFLLGQTILIDSERMLIVDVAGNNLTVKRAWDGSVLAAHSTNADIYALTGIVVSRGQLGTTAAAHSSGATIYRHVVPGLVRELTIAEALTTLGQQTSSYATKVSSGDGERDAGGVGLPDLRDKAIARYGRRARKRAI